MSLNFINKDEILKSNKETEVVRLTDIDRSILKYDQSIVHLDETDNVQLELHVYSLDGVYLTGNHQVPFTIEASDITVNTGSFQHVVVDTRTALDGIGIQKGQYKVVYNTFENLLGSFEGQKIWIKEISPSRKEIKIRLPEVVSNSIQSGNSKQVNPLQEDLIKLTNKWNSTIQSNTAYTFLLNFGFDITYQIVNFRVDRVNGQSEIVVKLYTALDAGIIEKANLWISQEIIPSVANTIQIIPEAIAEPVNTLAGPNFTNTEYDSTSIATDFKSWSELLGSNIQTSQQIIDTKFSGSLSGVKLNINYHNFENFVHFSTATERVKNFQYKMELIEFYTDRLITLFAIPTASLSVQTNISDTFTKRNEIVSGFDDFEKYLFFESTGSVLYTHCSNSGSIDPWPKSTPQPLTWQQALIRWQNLMQQWINVRYVPNQLIGDPYTYFPIQQRTTSATAIAYYENLLALAAEYDRNNVHRLRNTIPLHVQNTAGNEEMMLFVDMLGQHFDILWTYIKNLTSIQQREEHPKDGMPDELLYEVAKSFGFNLLNGKSSSDLWKYAFGVDVNGNRLQTSISGSGIDSIPDSDHTKEIWRRIVNNLPYLLKNKGTARSVKALLTCFGIPSTTLTIKEYGGPSTFTDMDHYPEYVHDKYHYAWRSDTGSLFISASQYLNGQNTLVYPDTLEFRFKTDNNATYSVNSPYTIFSTVSSSLTLTKTSADTNVGKLELKLNNISGSINGLEIFDNSWHIITIENLNNSSGSLKATKSLYGKTIYIQSASMSTGSGVFPFQEDMAFASGSNKIFGHFQEIRFWSGSLNSATLSEHAASPYTYTYNVDRINFTNGSQASKPYDHLLQRFTLSVKDIQTGLKQPSVHPNQKINTGSLFFIGFTNSGSIQNQFEGFEEVYYTPSPSLGGNSLYTNKIRLESSSINVNDRLNTKTRVEKSSFDRYSIDSNKVGVYFSPQTAINEDIFNQLGYFEIDDYIGNPDDINKTSYPALENFAINYWKKYENRNDFEAYFRALKIYDFTIFNYIKQLLPHRTNPMLGLVVEPNVLERSKVKTTTTPVIEDLTKDAVIESVEPVLESSYHLIEADIDSDNLVTVSAGDVNFIPAPVGQIISPSNNVDKLGTNWVQNRFISRYKLRESGSYQPVQLFISSSRPSAYARTIGSFYYSSSLSASLNLPYSSSLVPAEINFAYSTGQLNLYYNGSKLSGAGINVDSTETVDGGPVVKITQVNPNQLVFSNNQITTIDEATTGAQKANISNIRKNFFETKIQPTLG